MNNFDHLKLKEKLNCFLVDDILK